MIRIVALIAGLLLFVCPGLWLLDFTGFIRIISKYRKVISADSLVVLGVMLLATYGSVFFGVAVSWVRTNRSGQPFLPNEVFKAGMFGVLAGCIVYFVGGSIYFLAKYGSSEKVIGNLSGLVAIFWGVLGALVSAGMALLLYAWRGPAGPIGPTPGPWSSPPRIPPS
jgi:hypothetical protein